MSTQGSHEVGTTSQDYSAVYYSGVHDYADYGWESEEWRGFFLGVARRIVGLVGPARVLDVGCAKGLLVQALVENGVDAYGVDIAEFAVASAHDDVRDRLRVGSATDDLGGPFDLVTCVEVLEHMAPSDVQLALDRICESTDRVLFSSTPGHFEEPTHVNVHPTATWAGWFAERGFYRRTDADTEFLSNWAVLFERTDPTLHAVVQRYESLLAPLREEVLVKRRALLDADRELTELRAGFASVDELRATIASLEGRLERVRDRVEQLRAKAARLRGKLDERNAEVEALRSSRSWRVGSAITRPLGRIRRSG